VKEGIEVRDHINEMNRIVMDLASVDIKIDSEDQALKLLYSLPPSYNSLVQTFCYEKKTLIIEEVTSAILQDDARIKSQKKAQEIHSGDAMLARERKVDCDVVGHSKKPKSMSKKGPKCFKCG
jgi:gag-polypeptide of LTR copia-type